MRTLQTAAAIAKEIGHEQIVTNYRVAEYLTQKLFPKGSPIGNLTIDKAGEDLSQLENEWLYGVKVDH